MLVDRLLRYGQGVRLQLPILEDLSENVFLHLVLFEMFHHEFFHHLVESAASTIEILASALGAPIPSYLDYREKTWAGAFGWRPHQPLEEPLANAYAYNSLGFISRVNIRIIWSDFTKPRLNAIGSESRKAIERPGITYRAIRWPDAPTWRCCSAGWHHP